MDYAKRAAELVQVDNIAGRWMPVLGGEYIVDPNGEHADEQTERVRAWLAAELQAAHGAGAAEERERIAAYVIDASMLKADASVATRMTLAIVGGRIRDGRHAQTEDRYTDELAAKWAADEPAKEYGR